MPVVREDRHLDIFKTFCQFASPLKSCLLLFFFQVLSTNAVYWLLILLCLSHSKISLPEALPSGALPKGGRWETSGSDEESEIEQDYVSPEDRVYKRLMTGRLIGRSLQKRTSAYVKRGRLLNRNGYALSINSDGTVDGTTNKNSRFGKVLFCLD